VREGQAQTQFATQDGNVIVARSQDVEYSLERAKALHREDLTTTAMGDKLAAILPLVLIEAYINNNGITMQDFMREPRHTKAMLTDPALSDFRVWKGAI
jgi:hypothetical protein